MNSITMKKRLTCLEARAVGPPVGAWFVVVTEGETFKDAWQRQGSHHPTPGHGFVVVPAKTPAPDSLKNCVMSSSTGSPPGLIHDSAAAMLM